ncbi:hypothetical protein GCM10009727_37910 [Actinomadura napierensis]|uniref:Uncharacterized protein n=1 Tax=Actinomadura napierensis TaxID=267854 RepID=A0ABP5L525_9ACTN
MEIAAGLAAVVDRRQREPEREIEEDAENGERDHHDDRAQCDDVPGDPSAAFRRLPHFHQHLALVPAPPPAMRAADYGHRSEDPVTG